MAVDAYGYVHAKFVYVIEDISRKDHFNIYT